MKPLILSFFLVLLMVSFFSNEKKEPVGESIPVIYNPALNMLPASQMIDTADILVDKTIMLALEP